MLQKQVLSDVLNDPNITVYGVSEGKRRMKKMMCSLKVLVVLDDVDHIDQLEALAGDPNWFNSGSRVIITTRDEQVLIAHGLPKNLILDVNLLSHEEASCLFNKYAFGRVIPNKGYKILSDQVVRYVAGLPLSVKVLGSFLRGKDKLEWTDALERLKTIPLKETLEILELSYNSLEEDYKEIFLDVACILKGWNKKHAIKALESCGFHARSGLRVLELKSLITVSDGGVLGMHDHIEEMGKNIVRRLHPNEPYKHSRLWIKEEIKDILLKDKGTEATRYIKVSTSNPFMVMKGLQNMKELRFLSVRSITKENLYHYSHNYYYHPGIIYLRLNYDDSDLDYHDTGEDSQYLPNSLRYLFWSGYPFTCLPKNFQASNLVGLEIHFSSIHELWEGGERKVLKKLRFIDLYFCELRTLDIGLFLNLESLTLVACDYLVELHLPYESLKLKHLRLEHLKIKTLDLKGTLNLERLYVEDCEDLVELHMPIEELKLKSIYIFRSYKLRTLNLRGGLNLEKLDLVGCDDLVELHMPSEEFNLTSLYLFCSYKLRTLNLMGAMNLEKLDIIECKDLVELYMPIEEFKLQSLYLFFSYKLRTLNLKESLNLKRLDLIDCVDLTELHLPVKNFELKVLELHCSKLRILDLKGAMNLEMLHIEPGEGLLEMDLVELHMPVENFELKSLDICYSKLRTLDLMSAYNLVTLNIKGCEDLEELHMPIECQKLNCLLQCPKMKSLNLTRTWNLKKLDLVGEDLVELRMPIESLGLKSISIRSSNLRTLYLGFSPNLEFLDLKDCYSLVDIHAPVGCLRKLMHINISGCVRFKPFMVNQGLPMIGSSTELHLTARSLDICPLHPINNLPKFQFECTYKELLPPSAGNLEKLLSFGLCACTNLVRFSESICGLQCLRKLTLEGSLTEIPEEIDQLECLEELILSSRQIKHLPDSICMLKNLKNLQFKHCSLLEQLPQNLGRLECLEELHITDCIFLRDIPSSICEMKHLKYFHLPYCILIENLPEEVGCLKCLKELNIKGAGISHLPRSIFQLKGLLIIGSRWRLKSFGFTSVTENSKHTAFSCYI